MELELTDEERKAIKALRRLEKAWPADLMLYSWAGTLGLWRGNPADGGEELATFKITSDGGDPQ